jgi:hypothetical protein
MGKKKWRNRRQPSIFVFTSETVSLALEALALFDTFLVDKDHLDDKIVFAEQTLQQVKQKLQIMKDSIGDACLTGFDFNEKIVLRQCMLAYTVELLAQPPSQKRAKELRQCRIIASHFTDQPGTVSQ